MGSYYLTETATVIAQDITCICLLITFVVPSNLIRRHLAFRTFITKHSCDTTKRYRYVFVPTYAYIELKCWRLCPLPEKVLNAFGNPNESKHQL